MSLNVDRELEKFGVTDCLSTTDHKSDDECGLCGDAIKTYREHEHFQGKSYHTYCLLLLAFRKVEEEREACADIVQDFDEWAWCTCSECKVDGGSHAVATDASLQTLAAQLRARTVKE